MICGFRFSTSIAPNLNFRGFCGTLASGVVRKGDEIVVLPSRKKSRVKSIVTYDEELEWACADMAITLTLEDEIDISRGDMIVHTDNFPVVTDSFSATIVWMIEEPMLPGKLYDFKFGTKTSTGNVTTLKHEIDVNTLAKRPAPSLELNSIGVCDITVAQQVCVDNYALNRSTGAFIIIDRLTNVTVGAGMIEVSAGDSGTQTEPSSPQGHVTREERAARYGQNPATIMFNRRLGFRKVDTGLWFGASFVRHGACQYGSRRQGNAPRYQQRSAARSARSC